MLKFTRNITANRKLIDETAIEKGFEYNIPGKGQLYFTGNEYWLSYDNKQYSINKSFQVIDTTTSVQVGLYKCTSRIFCSYPDKLIWQGHEYKFKKVKPDIRYSLFNKDTWGHFKFQLSKDNEIVIYSFKIDVPAICLGNPYSDKSFEGSVEIKNTSPLIALAGIFLVERALDNETVN